MGLDIMDKKYENNPVMRDIEICKRCTYFHKENDPDTGRGFHWGVGYRCGAVAFGVPWSKESYRAVSEDEFVRSTIHFTTGKGRCCQNKD